MEKEQLHAFALDEAREKLREKEAAELACEFQEVAHALAESKPIKPKLLLGEQASKHAPSSMPKGCILKGSSIPQKILAPLEGTYKCLRKGRELAALQLGERVERGQILGFIQVMAMQCMIQAPCKGVIEAVYVEQGKHVALDQCLMVIRPLI